MLYSVDRFSVRPSFCASLSILRSRLDRVCLTFVAPVNLVKEPSELSSMSPLWLPFDTTYILPPSAMATLSGLYWLSLSLFSPVPPPSESSEPSSSSGAAVVSALMLPELSSEASSSSSPAGFSKMRTQTYCPFSSASKRIILALPVSHIYSEPSFAKVTPEGKESV